MELESDCDDEQNFFVNVRWLWMRLHMTKAREIMAECRSVQSNDADDVKGFDVTKVI